MTTAIVLFFPGSTVGFDDEHQGELITSLAKSMDQQARGETWQYFPGAGSKNFLDFYFDTGVNGHYQTISNAVSFIRKNISSRQITEVNLIGQSRGGAICIALLNHPDTREMLQQQTIKFKNIITLDPANGYFIQPATPMMPPEKITIVTKDVENYITFLAAYDGRQIDTYIPYCEAGVNVVLHDGLPVNHINIVGVTTKPLTQLPSAVLTRLKYNVSNLVFVQAVTDRKLVQIHKLLKKYILKTLKTAGINMPEDTNKHLAATNISDITQSLNQLKANESESTMRVWSYQAKQPFLTSSTKENCYKIFDESEAYHKTQKQAHRQHLVRNACLNIGTHLGFFASENQILLTTIILTLLLDFSLCRSAKITSQQKNITYYSTIKNIMPSALTTVSNATLFAMLLTSVAGSTNKLLLLSQFTISCLSILYQSHYQPIESYLKAEKIPENKKTIDWLGIKHAFLGNLLYSLFLILTKISFTFFQKLYRSNAGHAQSECFADNPIGFFKQNICPTTDGLIPEQNMNNINSQHP